MSHKSQEKKSLREVQYLPVTEVPTSNDIKGTAIQ